MSTPIRTSFQALRSRSTEELAKFYQRPIAKVSTELLMTIISVVFLGVFAITPTLSTMSQLLKDIEDRKQTDQALTKKLAALSTVSSEVLASQRNINLLDSVIPNTPDFDGALRRIEKIASDKNLVLTFIRVERVPTEPQTSNAPSQLSSFELTISVKGKYADIQTFFRQLLAADRMMSITNLSFNAQKEEATNARGTQEAAQQTLVQAQATVQVHYYGVPIEGKK